jgi:hypothetical protein
MPQRRLSADHRCMLVDVLGALLFFAAFMIAWSTVGAWQERRDASE